MPLEVISGGAILVGLCVFVYAVVRIELSARRLQEPSSSRLATSRSVGRRVVHRQVPNASPRRDAKGDTGILFPTAVEARTHRSLEPEKSGADERSSHIKDLARQMFEPLDKPHELRADVEANLAKS